MLVWLTGTILCIIWIKNIFTLAYIKQCNSYKEKSAILISSNPQSTNPRGPPYCLKAGEGSVAVNTSTSADVATHTYTTQISCFTFTTWSFSLGKHFRWIKKKHIFWCNGPSSVNRCLSFWWRNIRWLSIGCLLSSFLILCLYYCYCTFFSFPFWLSLLN